MKKISLIIFSLLVITSVLKSQQLPLYSQYMMNGFLLNPGITGSVEYVPVRLTVREQWAGLEDAPSTQALSTHALLSNKHIGVGGYILEGVGIGIVKRDTIIIGVGRYVSEGIGIGIV